MVELLYFIKSLEKVPARVISSAARTAQGKKKFLTPESTGMRKNHSSLKGAGPTQRMEQITNLPHEQLCHSYPMLHRHNSTRPFPHNGTTGNGSQIARSILSHFPKVKENLGEIAERHQTPEKMAED